MEEPYLTKQETITVRSYNPQYGDDRICICGHPYYRHFDTYEDMYPIGCKYCGCQNFIEKPKVTKRKPKYLVRPDDFMIFVVDPLNGCYRGHEMKEIKNRPNAYEHFTFENLTVNYGFFPIKAKEIPFYNKKCKFHYAFLSWQHRNDGHGEAQGGTMEEYLEHLERVKRWKARNKNKKKE